MENWLPIFVADGVVAPIGIGIADVARCRFRCRCVLHTALGIIRDGFQDNLDGLTPFLGRLLV